MFALILPFDLLAATVLASNLDLWAYLKVLFKLTLFEGHFTVNTFCLGLRADLEMNLLVFAPELLIAALASDRVRGTD